MSITQTTPRESAIAAIASDYQHEALAWSVTAENLEKTITRLHGEASVMIGLLTEAVGVLQTIEPECSTADEMLTRLRADIWAVLTEYASEIKDDFCDAAGNWENAYSMRSFERCIAAVKALDHLAMEGGQ